eukprot:TRINITY_DN7171_c0_g1_i1.p1 TRINITY_DN7171_c0_g1~~TRINITY_DN7171_c0_g1_i1.p1  ORF type:complete len:282 (+),score=42.34 TRINITY_DN7171_c0_g1_i1:188-1033(+)
MSITYSININWKIVVGVVAGIFVISMFSSSSGQPRSDDVPVSVDWKETNFLEQDLPSNLNELMKGVEISQGEAIFYGQSIFFQSGNIPGGVERSGRTVLLLHGAAFSSQTWIDRVPTLRTLAALGHGVIAVDLPGFGKSRQASVPDKGEFLARLIRSLSGKQPVVVSPSMSGSFIIPMLAKPENRNLISGWVPVAPVGTSQVATFGKDLKTPTLIVYGERDTGLGTQSTKDLSILPNATLPQVLPGAGHPAYLDQPDLWHKLLHNFINKVNMANFPQFMEA